MAPSSIVVIDLEGVRSLGAVERDLGFVRSGTTQISNMVAFGSHYGYDGA
jgi:hypothetical protein